MDERIIEICKVCGNNKVEAIRLVREEFNLGLVEAKELVDNAYKLLSGENMPVKSSGFFARRKETKEQARLQSQLYAEKHKNEARYDLSLLTGMQYANNSSYPTLWAKNDRTVYFEGNDAVFYRVIGFDWTGPRYTTITKSHTEGSEIGKTKRKGRFIGAAVGTVLLPGVGTVIGAAHGTGNKKSKSNNVSDTIITEHQSEIASQGALKMIDTTSGNVITVSVNCLSTQANKLSALVVENSVERSTAIQSENDPYEEVKKVKELLDMGIITQDEFDTKKKQLLGL